MPKKEKTQKKEIIYNIVNSLLAGGLVFCGSLTTGEITLQGAGAALIAAMIISMSKFKNYWESEKDEYKCGLFNIA